MLGIAAIGQLSLAQMPPTIAHVKPRDSHGSDHYIRRRHPPVYSDEYYAQLQPLAVSPEIAAPTPDLVPVRNLRIPLSKLISARAVPTLHQAPPSRPVPSLTTNPPKFRMTTPEEAASDDAMIIAALLED